MVRRGLQTAMSTYKLFVECFLRLEFRFQTQDSKRDKAELRKELYTISWYRCDVKWIKWMKME
jgi:hypothetical protein